MNLETLRLLYRHEMLMLLRGRRTIVMSIILPALLMPLMLLGSRYAQDQRQQRLDETIYRYSVTGQVADHIRELIAQNKDLERFRNLKLQEVPATDARAILDAGEIDFYLQTFSAAEADGQSKDEKRLKGVPLVQMVFRGNRDISENGSGRMLELLGAARRNAGESALVASGFSVEPDDLLAVDSRNIATDAQVTGASVGRLITVFLVMLLFTGGSVAAMDIIAGEKERGTLETLLTSAASRISIVTAKQMAICTVALTITLLQALNFLMYIQLRLLELPSNFSLDVSSAGVAALFALFIPLAASIAAVLLLISAYARSYKEAQLHFFPAYILGIVPALASVLPGVRLQSAIVLVPIANVSVATRDILMNRADPVMVLVAIAAMSATAFLLMRFSARLLVREDVVVSSNAENAAFIGGEALFKKRIMRWFAVMWALVFVLAANVAWFQKFQVQLLFNELGVFLGASLVMIALYKLDVRRVLSIRAVRWPVWLAIPIMIPSGFIATFGLLKLSNLVVPAPEEMLRQFSNQVVPENTPAWQLYLLIAILPAICEEIAFRGVLLHGLQKRFRPAVVCIVVGIIFGLFHYSLFRIAPTAFLGIILTAIAVMTGSIFPGMLLHGGNNAFALWTGMNDFPFDGLSWGQYAAASVIFALALRIVYNCRGGNSAAD